MAEPKEKVTFTKEEKDRIGRTASGVFAYCAGDLFEGMKAMEPKKKNHSISRAGAIEIALDASRTEEELRRQNHRELADKVEKADYEQLKRICRPYFDNRYYE